MTFPTALLMRRNITLRRFSNYESGTVRNSTALDAALRTLETVIHDPAFETRVGQRFGFDSIESAMAYEATPGTKAVLVP